MRSSLYLPLSAGRQTPRPTAKLSHKKSIPQAKGIFGITEDVMGLFEASAELPKVGDVPKLGTAALRKALKTLRTKPVRQSKLVVVIGKALLSSKADLGTEGNTILEQV